ncbi:MAG TPA: FliA/WhiG family RNA polymerase sigma factor [Blastocatellia bacterium]|nr:FliA/WhiG family RNA polymerase sigma factor [Blastocatellia bacterium]
MMPLKRTYTTYSANSRAAARTYRGAAIDRDALVEAHLPQVKFIADRLAAKLPPSVDREDLIGAGVLGLLDAVDKFDPERGVQFKTYAEMRVRGAMLDSLRSLDWAPRSMRQRAREVEAAYRQIERERGRPAEEEEVVARLGITIAEFHTLLNDLRGLTILGLEWGDEDDEHQALQIPDDASRGPLAIYERAEMRSRLTRAIDRLPERERQVMALYYLEELTMKEVGAVLGITESRVSQLHTQAVLRLRAALAVN